MRNTRFAVAAALLLVAVVAAFAMYAQTSQAPAAVKRNIVLKQDMTIPGHEAVMALVELPPGSAEGRHTHPAEVYVFVLQGTILQQFEGKPDVTLKAGDHFYVAPGQIHQAINKGSDTAKLAAVFVAEKGKPLTTKAE
ncbi:MAG: cupin domain-containing protein [Acidobacteriia bacterium]|nr:cupin domain-containing protein [Terriglobia bacterium]